MLALLFRYPRESPRARPGWLQPRRRRHGASAASTTAFSLARNCRPTCSTAAAAAAPVSCGFAAPIVAPSANAGEAVDRVEQLAALLGRDLLVAGGQRSGHAVVDVLVEDLERHRIECGRDGRDLGDDVDAVAVLFDHLLDASHLSLDPVQALDQRRLVRGVAIGGGGGGGH